MSRDTLKVWFKHDHPIAYISAALFGIMVLASFIFGLAHASILINSWLLPKSAPPPPRSCRDEVAIVSDTRGTDCSYSDSVMFVEHEAGKFVITCHCLRQQNPDAAAPSP